MRYFRTLILSATLLGASSLIAQPYQAWGYQDRGERQSYRVGFEQGRSDAASGRSARPNDSRYRDRDDRDAFRRGYDEGYRSARGSDRGRDDDRWRNNNGGNYGNGAYGGGGYNNSAQAARQNGMRDGMNDGRNDRASGHSFRPTQDDNYKNAPGYNSSMGSRQQYKDTYRAAYQQAYQQGYNGGGGGWRR
jgi:hypothetical protein